MQATAADEQFLSQLVSSYETFTGGRFPIDGHGAVPLGRALQEAPFGLFAHNADADPLFVFANNAAAAEFGYQPAEMIGMPSRLSAAPGIDQEERSRLFRALDEAGYFAGYQGRRVRKDGSVFWIADVTIWNIEDTGHRRIGQGALIRSFIDPLRRSGRSTYGAAQLAHSQVIPMAGV
ncbi:MEKHLA domain-containing protein [Leifsonia shinshuensis]|uniref:MEKHLA domain-containing protein n=1 Tax=Leifsonia shinshuensis TaxID=150026 RepID=UPI002855DC1B|nr:MEKHLA domain-containing protein [Leifsonia shinshuensis]MDR6972722.1 PAS domain S-box-containing protein [Leifsonia shinshuensis]